MEILKQEDKLSTFKSSKLHKEDNFYRSIRPSITWSKKQLSQAGHILGLSPIGRIQRDIAMPTSLVWREKLKGPPRGNSKWG